MYGICDNCHRNAVKQTDRATSLPFRPPEGIQRENRQGDAEGP